MSKIMYHITKKSNVQSILNGGLKTKDGKVFLFNQATVPYCEGFYRWDKFTKVMRNIEVEHIIAKNELMLKEYALFAVDVEGYTLNDDNCMESIAEYQKFVTKDIPADRLEYLGEFKVKPFWDFEKLDYNYEVPAWARVVHYQTGKQNFGYGLVAK